MTRTAGHLDGSYACVAALLALGTACGGDPHEPMLTLSKRMDGDAHELAQLTSAACGAAEVTTCTRGRSENLAAARPLVVDLVETAPELDAYLREAGRDDAADTACAAGDAGTALDALAAAPCPGPGGVQPARGCEDLLSFAGQIHARAQALTLRVEHRYRIGGSGIFPGWLYHDRESPHAWPWSAGTDPVMAGVCSAR